MMSEQQSQKRGARSDSQKLNDAREGYDAMGSTSRQEGASGKQTKTRQSDQDVALKTPRRGSARQQE
jgi:hypothetical protein